MLAERLVGVGAAGHEPLGSEASEDPDVVLARVVVSALEHAKLLVCRTAGPGQPLKQKTMVKKQKKKKFSRTNEKFRATTQKLRKIYPRSLSSRRRRRSFLSPLCLRVFSAYISPD